MLVFSLRTYKSRIRHVRRCKTHISALKTLLIYMLIKYMPGYPKIQYERHMINSKISFSLPNKLIKFKEHLNERSRTSFIYKKKKLSAFLLLKALVNGNIFLLGGGGGVGAERRKQFVASWAVLAVVQSNITIRCLSPGKERLA